MNLKSAVLRDGPFLCLLREVIAKLDTFAASMPWFEAEDVFKRHQGSRKMIENAELAFCVCGGVCQPYFKNAAPHSPWWGRRFIFIES